MEDFFNDFFSDVVENPNQQQQQRSTLLPR